MTEPSVSIGAPTLQGVLPSTARAVATDDLPLLLKQCAPEVVQAARQYRRNRQADLVPIILNAIAARYVDEEHKHHLAVTGGEVRLAEDLGLDSLSLIEISMSLEDIMLISLSEDRLRQARTLDEVTQIIRDAATKA